MKDDSKQERERANAGVVSLRSGPGSVGCLILDEMRRVTPKGAAKPWKTQENIATVERVAAAGVGRSELLAYVRGCAAAVREGLEEPRWWSVRQLFCAPTMDYWRAHVAELEARAERREQDELDRKARAAREEAQRQAAREAARAAPADLEIRRAADPVLQRARMQELTASLVDRLGGGVRSSSSCPACKVEVAAKEARCFACGQALVDADGRRRGGLRHA